MRGHQRDGRRRPAQENVRQGTDHSTVTPLIVNDWRVPSLPAPKDRDFATSIGPWVVTDYEPAGFRWEHARELAAKNTRLRPGDVLVAPPFAVGVQAVDVPGLGALAV